MNTKIYYHSESIVLPIGTVGLMSVDLSLPETYNKIIGFGIATTDNGGDANFKVGLRKNLNEILNATHNIMTAISSDVAPKEKLLDVNTIIQQGNKLTLTLKFNLALTREFSIDAIFKTVNPNACPSNEALPLAEGDQGQTVVMADVQPHPFR